MWERFYTALLNRILLLIGRAVLTVVYNSEGTQKVQAEGLAGEVFEKMERMEEYGMTTYPKAGAEMVPVFFGGNRGQGLVLVIHDRRYRPVDLQEGEVCLYTYEGKAIHMKQGQVIDVLGNEVNLGGLRAAVKRLVHEEAIAIYNGHKHSYTDDGNPMTTGVPDSLLTINNHATDITRAK